MTTETYTQAADDIQTAAKSTAAEGKAVLKDTVAAAQKTLADTAKQTRSAVKDGLDTFDAQARPYIDAAAEHAEDARRFVTENVKSKPIASAVVAVAAGVILGALLTRREA